MLENEQEEVRELSDNIFTLTSSRNFSGWLSDRKISLGFSTYAAGKLFLLGVKSDGQLSVFERSFPRCMGMAVSDDAGSMFVSTEFQIFRLDNIASGGDALVDDTDALFAPHQAWITGDIDIHDIGFSACGQPIFVNTLFSCIATVSEGFSFRPVWQPPFISKLAPEDRCHLNGMAMRAGEPVFATCVSRSDISDGWRDRRINGGILMDVSSSEIIASGLSMPHSPRLHNEQLWLLNSGTGELGYVDLANGRFEAVAFLPGFARGLAIVGNHAVVGLSLPRESRAFSGLELEASLELRDADPRCGLIIIDLLRGEIIEWVRIEGSLVRELYDVAILPGVRSPQAIGFKTDEIKRMISIDQ